MRSRLCMIEYLQIRGCPTELQSCSFIKASHIMLRVKFQTNSTNFSVSFEKNILLIPILLIIFASIYRRKMRKKILKVNYFVKSTNKFKSKE